MAHTLNHHRARHKHFATVPAIAPRRWSGYRHWRQAKQRWALSGPIRGRSGRAGVVYSGQGSQWAGMGRQLLADEPAFAAAVAELEPCFVEQVGFAAAGARQW